MIEIEGLKKSYGNKVVLDGVCLTVPDGAVFGLVGINGAGKSTLLRLIADVLRPDAGTIRIDGELVTGNAKKRREMFFLPDEPFYSSGTTVEKLIELYKTFYMFDQATFDRFAQIFRIDRRAPVRNFSKGMKRQVFAALALATRPRYLLLDEAFDGLDPLARLELKRGLIGLEGSTVLISSHSTDAGDLHGALRQVHKFQIALDRTVVREDIPFDCLSFETEGRVARFIVRGDREEIVAALRTLSPLFVEEISVDFEELFLCEVQKRGYMS